MEDRNDSLGSTSPTRYASSDLGTLGQALKEAGFQIRQISFSYENATRTNIEADIIKIEKFVTSLIAGWAALREFIEAQIEKLEPNETPSGRATWPAQDSKSNNKPAGSDVVISAGPTATGLSKMESKALGIGLKPKN